MILQDLSNKLVRLVRDRRGAAITEYIIIVGLIAIIAIGAYKAFGSAISSKVDSQTQKIKGL
jgi:Flp pilus assembly pilin Flp